MTTTNKTTETRTYRTTTSQAAGYGTRDITVNASDAAYWLGVWTAAGHTVTELGPCTDAELDEILADGARAAESAKRSIAAEKASSPRRSYRDTRTEWEKHMEQQRRIDRGW